MLPVGRPLSLLLLRAAAVAEAAGDRSRAWDPAECVPAECAPAECRRAPEPGRRACTPEIRALRKGRKIRCRHNCAP